MLTQLRNNPLKRAILAMILPAVAGMVNATSFFMVSAYSSHVTGTVTRLGLELSQRSFEGIVHVGSGLLSFLLGVMGAATLVELARRQARARYAAPLVLEALSLLAILVSNHLGGRAATSQFGLFCFAMGLQNSLVTRISGAVVRTTHMSGITTDIGVELVQFLLWGSSELRGLPHRRWAQAIPGLFRNHQFTRLWLHLRIWCSFLTGAIVGPLLYAQYHELMLLLPAGIVLALAVFDVRSGLDLVASAKLMQTGGTLPNPPPPSQPPAPEPVPAPSGEVAAGGRR